MSFFASLNSARLREALGGAIASVPMNYVVDFSSGTPGQIIDPTIIAAGSRGTAPGMWLQKQYGTPGASLTHTKIEKHAITLPFSLEVDGSTYDGSEGQGLTFDFDDPAAIDGEFDILQLNFVETITELTVVYLARYDLELDAGSPIALTQEPIGVHGADYVVSHFMKAGDGSESLKIHSNTDVSRAVSYAGGWLLRTLRYSESRGYGEELIQDPATQEVLGYLRTQFDGSAGFINYLTLKSYLGFHNGTGKVKIVGLDWDNAAFPLRPITVPAATSVVVTQTAAGVVNLTCDTDIQIVRVERRIGSGGWTTIAAAYDRQSAPNYHVFKDESVEDGTAYTYRVTPLVHSYEATPTESNEILINNAPYAGGAAILAQTLGSNAETTDQRGFRFTNTGVRTLTHLGLWVLGSANGQFDPTIDVILYSVTGVSGNQVNVTELARVSVPTTGAVNDYTYVALSSPVVLANGAQYAIATAKLGFNRIKQLCTATSVATGITILDAVSGSVVDLGHLESFGDGANKMHGPVNFKYTL